MSDIIFLPNQDYTLQDGGNPYIISAVGDSEGDAQTEATEKFNAEFSECQSYVYIGTLGNPINYGVDNGDGTYELYRQQKDGTFVLQKQNYDGDISDLTQTTKDEINDTKEQIAQDDDLVAQLEVKLHANVLY